MKKKAIALTTKPYLDMSAYLSRSLCSPLFVYESVWDRSCIFFPVKIIYVNIIYVKGTFERQPFLVFILGSRHTPVSQHPLFYSFFDVGYVLNGQKAAISGRAGETRQRFVILFVYKSFFSFFGKLSLLSIRRAHFFCF